MAQITLQQTSSIEGPGRVKEIALIHFLTVSALYVFFVADFANKVLIYFGSDFSRFSVLFRSLYELLFFGIILLFPNRQRTLFLILMFSTFVMFVIGQAIFAARVDFHVNFKESVLLFNKYFFVFIIYYAIYKLQENPRQFKSAIRVMEKLFLLNAWFTLIGAALGIEIFRTYVLQSYRYGYSGILWVQNEATIMCFLGVSYFYYKHFILGEKSKQFWIVVAASLLLGTKSIYLVLALLLLFHFMSNSKVTTKFTVIVFGLIIYYSVTWFLQTELAAKYLAYFVNKAEGNGLLYMLTSGRSHLLGDMYRAVLQHWTPINYLVGGQDQQYFMVEMDFLDLFLFLGIAGFVIYFILTFASIFRFNLKRPFLLFFVFSYMSMAFVAGHFFSSVINAVYLCLICMYFYVTSKRSPALNEENTARQ